MLDSVLVVLMITSTKDVVDHQMIFRPTPALTTGYAFRTLNNGDTSANQNILYLNSGQAMAFTSCNGFYIATIMG